MACFSVGDTLLLQFGKSNVSLKPDIIDQFYGERARRGNMLPKGFRQVSGITVVRERGEE